MNYNFKNQLILLWILLILFIPSSSQSLILETGSEIQYNPIDIDEYYVINFSPGDLYYSKYGDDLQYGGTVKNNGVFYPLGASSKEFIRNIFAPEFEMMDLNLTISISNYPYTEVIPRITTRTHIREETIIDGEIESLDGFYEDYPLVETIINMQSNSTFDLSVSRYLNYSYWNKEILLENGSRYDSNKFTLENLVNGYHIDREDTISYGYQYIRFGLRVPDGNKYDEEWNMTTTVTIQVEGRYDPILYDQLTKRYNKWVSDHTESNGRFDFFQSDEFEDFGLWFGIPIIIYVIGIKIVKKIKSKYLDK